MQISIQNLIFPQKKTKNSLLIVAQVLIVKSVFMWAGLIKDTSAVIQHFGCGWALRTKCDDMNN